MTIRLCFGRLACWLVPVAGLLLVAGYRYQWQATPTSCTEDVDDASSHAGLRSCPDPQLEPLQDNTDSSTMPVAYPASQLERPLLMARPFPLGGSPGAFPRSAMLPPASQAANPATAAPDVTGPDLPLPVEAPTTEVLNGSPPNAPVLAPPEHLPDVRRHSPLNESPQNLSAPARNFPAPRAPMPAPAGNLIATPQRVAGPRPYRQPDAMRAVTLQAQQTIRRGYYLAERGALYSARAEFIQALRAIAQAHDVQSASREHTHALSAGLTALEESEDFVPDGSQLESDLDVAALVKAHQTPICKDREVEQLMPVVVLQHYYSFAQQQLALAAGGEEAASMALFGLGKTYATLAIDKSMPSAIAEPKAMVFHWAAISAHPGNFLAANELAVLEARWGQYAAARSLLQHSLSVLPHAAVWRNLAVVHQRLGEVKLAELAMRESEIATQREASTKPGNPQGIVPTADVEWLDSKSFAATSRTEIDAQKPPDATPDRSGPKPTPVVTPAPPRNRSAAAWWFPWLR